MKSLRPNLIPLPPLVYYLHWLQFHLTALLLRVDYMREHNILGESHLL